MAATAYERAKQIASAFQRITELNKAISDQFKLIATLMKEDEQPQYVLDDVEELRITQKRAVHADIVGRWMQWDSNADNRREEK